MERARKAGKGRKRGRGEDDASTQGDTPRPSEAAWRAKTLALLEDTDGEIYAHYLSGELTVRRLHEAVAAALGVNVDKASKAFIKSTLVKYLEDHPEDEDEEDEDDVEIGETLSPDDRRRASFQKARASGEVLEISSDDDDSAASQPERILLMHGSFNPSTLAHLELPAHIKKELKDKHGIECGDFFFATTGDHYVQRTKRQPCLRGADRRALILAGAAERGGLDYVRAVDGSRWSSGLSMIQTEFPDRPALMVEGSDTALRYGRKDHACVVVMRDGDSKAEVKLKRPGAFVVDPLPRKWGKVSSTVVRRKIHDPDHVAAYCGAAVVAAMRPMEWFEPW